MTEPVSPIDWARHYAAQREQQPARHTVDTITRDALDQLYATIRRLNYRAQRAESQNTAFRRAVAEWDVSERGTFIPHASLAAIGRAAGTDILGSVRHLRHFQRVEQAEIAATRAEAAIARVRSCLDQDQDGLCCSRLVGQVRAALDEPKGPRP